MSFLALLIAVVAETLLPDGLFDRARGYVNRLSQEFELDFVAFGVPAFAYLQWLCPVFIWLMITYLLNHFLFAWSVFLSGAFSVALLLYGLRFRHFAVVFTNLQLFLNQGDFFRAKDNLLIWIKSFGEVEPPIHNAGQVIFNAIVHGAERALRQFFSLIFWFLLVPGPFGVVLYLTVCWCVAREKEKWMYALATEPFSLAQLWESERMHALFSPRFALYVMEWFPARLLALCIGVFGQYEDMVLAWRQGQMHTRFSNRAPLTAVCLNAVGLVALSAEVTPDIQVQALRRFRQIIFKCAIAWLVLAMILALFGVLP